MMGVVKMGDFIGDENKDFIGDENKDIMEELENAKGLIEDEYNTNVEDKLYEVLENGEILEQLKIALKEDKDVEISGLIFKSNKYGIFKRLSGNRELDNNNVKKLKESIQENGYKKSQPITIDEAWNILNGQHRRKVCEELGLPIFFTIEYTENDSLKITQDFNQNQKNWALIDYIKSYADRGFEDYKKFIKLCQDENIQPSLAIWLLYSSRNGVIQNRIKNGELRCENRDIERAKKILNNIREIKECIPNTLPEERALRRAILSDKVAVPLMVIMEEENYRHDRMLKQVKEYFRSIDKRNMSTAGESLVALYNHRLRDQNSRLRKYSDM